MARFYSDPGSPIKVKYSPKIDKNGNIELFETGKENLQEYIDSFAEETSIITIIKQCAMGDTSALSKAQGMYGDFTDMPKTYRDVLQSVIDGENYFDSLPVEVKEKFDNSFQKWFATIGSEDWMKYMDYNQKSDDLVIEKESVENAES